MITTGFVIPTNRFVPDGAESARREFRQRLKLTPAWEPLIHHPMQQLMFWHQSPIKVCPAGRRSGKTFLAKRRAVLELIRKRPWPAKILIGAPTYAQVRKIYWEDMKRLIPKHWLAGRPNETRLEFTTTWGATLELMGMNESRRAEGVPWDWMLLDELADYKAGMWSKHLLPSLAGVGRTISAWLIGVPDEVGTNQVEHEGLWETGLQWPHKSPEICSFHWRSEEILSPAQIGFLKSNLDEQTYEQEFGGRFITSGGRALPRFSVADHVKADYCEYDPRLPLDWSLDFGYGTNARSLICQTYRGHVRVLDEIEREDGSTEVQVLAFRELCAKRGYSMRSVRLFGDVAGHGHGTARGESDYQIIEEMTRDLNIDPMTVRAPIPIKDTINAVRGRLCTADGVVHLHVHPCCKLLIADMKTAPWPDKLTAFHGLAALRYYLHALFGGQQAVFETSPLSLPMLGRGSTGGRR